MIDVYPENGSPLEYEVELPPLMELFPAPPPPSPLSTSPSAAPLMLSSVDPGGRIEFRRPYSSQSLVRTRDQRPGRIEALEGEEVRREKKEQKTPEPFWQSVSRESNIRAINPRINSE
jgi:hypothetical protein